jgi:hypothetical protein
LRAVTAGIGGAAWRSLRQLRLFAIAAAGFFFVAAILSHNGFVLNLYSLMAETPHLWMAASGLLLFAASWYRGAGRPACRWR